MTSSHEHRKPKLLIVTDSAALDTGLGRVAREIGTRLVAEDRYEVNQFGFFHKRTKRAVPFRIFHNRNDGEPKFGQLYLEDIIREHEIDLVLLIGDRFMFDDFLLSPTARGGAKVLWYATIDSQPCDYRQLAAMQLVDQVIFCTQFGQVAAQFAGFDVSQGCAVVHHGVETSVFHPLPSGHRDELRKKFFPNFDDPFVVGCVARNQPRKNIPALCKAFRMFVSEHAVCRQCGEIIFSPLEAAGSCPSCEAGLPELFDHVPAKSDAVLYLHMNPLDPLGHDLHSMVRRTNIDKQCVFGDVKIDASGTGVEDRDMNELYAAMDVFCLPTMGEGFGLPFLEAMAAGVPVLATGYSGHTDFVNGVGDLIEVESWVTDVSNNAERAVVSLEDMVAHLDRYYYEPEDYQAKWAQHLLKRGINIQSDPRLKVTGHELLKAMGDAGHRRAKLLDWKNLLPIWPKLVDTMLGIDSKQSDEERVHLGVELV